MTLPLVRGGWEGSKIAAAESTTTRHPAIERLDLPSPLLTKEGNGEDDLGLACLAYSVVLVFLVTHHPSRVISSTPLTSSPLPSP